MHLTRLALTDFRSYAAADLVLDPGVSTLLGANGQGKTNVVEAAGYVSTLGSHRVGTDAPLVRRGAERAILRAAITSAERDSLVEIEINPGPGQPGPGEPERGAPAPAGTGDIAHRAVRPRGSGPGQG